MAKILLLEDDEILSETLVELLENDGFDITLAKDGDSALNFTFESRFDIYIFDVNDYYCHESVGKFSLIQVTSMCSVDFRMKHRCFYPQFFLQTHYP